MYRWTLAVLLACGCPALAGAAAAPTRSKPVPQGPEKEETKMDALAPDISATNEEGQSVRLASFRDRSALVLFFFPRAFTPGCTAESCGFRDQSAGYQERGYQVLGVSRDTPEQLKTFKQAYGLPYHLLSDPDGQLAKALGVAPGARQTVVIGRDGRIERVFTQVAAKTHPADLLAELESVHK